MNCFFIWSLLVNKIGNDLLLVFVYSCGILSDLVSFSSFKKWVLTNIVHIRSSSSSRRGLQGPGPQLCRSRGAQVHWSCGQGSQQKPWTKESEGLFNTACSLKIILKFPSGGPGNTKQNTLPTLYAVMLYYKDVSRVIQSTSFHCFIFKMLHTIPSNFNIVFSLISLTYSFNSYKKNKEVVK